MRPLGVCLEQGKIHRELIVLHAPCLHKAVVEELRRRSLSAAVEEPGARSKSPQLCDGCREVGYSLKRYVCDATKMWEGVLKPKSVGVRYDEIIALTEQKSWSIRIVGAQREVGRGYLQTGRGIERVANAGEPVPGRLISTSNATTEELIS